MTPLAFFCYARPEHTRQTLAALAANRRSDEIALTVFCDGPRTPEALPKIAETRAMLHAQLDADDTFGSVEFVEREGNLGLTRSIIDGIGKLLERAEQVIVIEDDIVTAPAFLDYVLTGLDAYRDHPRVGSVTGYTPDAVSAAIPDDYGTDIFFSPRFSAWGWATWRDRWRKVDHTLPDYPAFKNDLAAQLAFNLCGGDVTRMLYHAAERGLDTWDIQTAFSFFLQRRLTAMPCRSLVENIGLDGSGVHCGADSRMAADLGQALETHRFPTEVETDERILVPFRGLFAEPSPGLIGNGAATYWREKRGTGGARKLAMAADWIALGDLEAAKQLLDVHMDRVPGDPEALVLMGEIALAIGASAPAADIFRAALLAWADHDAARQGLARAVNLSAVNVI